MNDLHKKIKERWPDAVESLHAMAGDETAIIKRESLLEIANAMKADAAFDLNVLIDITVVDGLDMNWRPRYQVVYHFYSTAKNHRLRLKVQVEEKDPSVPSLTDIWPIANWMEREAWDMFGIKFEGHPDLRRILMYDEFQGHPLRKDYPIDKRQPLIGPKN